MKVVGQQIRNDISSLGDADRAKRARTEGPARAEADSVVKISTEAKASMSADAPAASDRVARIKAEIESGGYPIDFEKLAEKILDDELGRWL